MNDLNSQIQHSDLKLFADDSRIIKSVDPCYSSKDQEKSQADLDSALKWAIDNNMSLSGKKF